MSITRKIWNWKQLKNSAHKLTKEPAKNLSLNQAFQNLIHRLKATFPIPKPDTFHRLKATFPIRKPDTFHRLKATFPIPKPDPFHRLKATFPIPKPDTFHRLKATFTIPKTDTFHNVKVAFLKSKTKIFHRLKARYLYHKPKPFNITFDVIPERNIFDFSVFNKLGASLSESRRIRSALLRSTLLCFEFSGCLSGKTLKSSTKLA